MPIENQQVPLLPPKKYQKFAYMHWVEGPVFGGGLEVWQWQPFVQKWCRPNHYSTGQDHELLGWRYVALCPTPPFEQELAKAVVVHETALRLLEAAGLHTEDELDHYRRLFHEHLKVL